jgi:RHS repeat-associated protein
MRRAGVAKNARTSLYLINRIKMRFVALFLLTVFVAGIMVPSASAITAMHTSETAKPLRQENYPEPIPLNVHEKMLSSNKVSPKLKKHLEQSKNALGTNNLKSILHKPEKKATQEPLRSIEKAGRPQAREVVDQRTATSSLFVNADGSLTKKEYFTPKHFKKAGTWASIDTTLIEDKNAADSQNFLGRAFGVAKSWVTDETTYVVKDNDWQARFAPSNDPQGIVRVKKGSSQVGFKPKNAQNVDPVIVNRKDRGQSVWYYDLWQGIDVEYIVESAAIKENIVIKSKEAASQFSFEIIGAQLEKVSTKDKSAPAFKIKGKGALEDSFAITPLNLILNNFGLVTEDVLSQTYKDNTLRVFIDENYLQRLPSKAFPAVIDPTITSTFGTRQGGNYVSFKTDGYTCYSNVCNLYAGSLYDTNNNLQYWRGAYFAPYDQFRNSTNILTDARLHLTQRSNESFWTGTWAAHNFQAGRATCLNNFNCVDGIWGDATFAGSGDINLTNLYQSRVNAGDFGAWIMVMGEDGTTSSFKNFDPNNSYVVFSYGGPPTAPSIASPVENQVYVDPQPSFKVNYVSNPNGSTPLQYEMMISSGQGGTGTLVTSGRQNAQTWTAPPDVLQDGSTYYLQARTYDPITGSFSPWSGSVAFKINMRTGNDPTQSYENFGPLDVNMATGSLTTRTGSHTTAALGGDIGIGLTYNSHIKPMQGLGARYWNLWSNFNGTWDDITGYYPDVTRIDQTVDFSWSNGSPSSVITSDWFAAEWEGYFVAPVAGDYYFGSSHDDDMRISVEYFDPVEAYSGSYCQPGPCYNQSVTLSEGEVVPLKIRFIERTGNATARVYVKGPVDEQILPSEWLRTNPRTAANEHGLTGRYYARLDGTNTFSAANPLVMQRTDSLLYFGWDSGAPVSGGPTDFLVRWTGYVTVPEDGVYNFGTLSDDGSKITIGTDNTVVYNDWTAHGPTEGYGSGYSLTANQPVPITIEYFDSGGAASFQFKVSGAVPNQVVPSDWLSTKADVLPLGWTLNVDPDGDLSYNHLKANQSSVTLQDSTGASHEYVWNGSGYKPPVNEDGNLVRNADGTFTLEDVDGRTYIFNSDGTIKLVTSSVDDRNPAALQYEYQSLNGGPAHLYRIKDGIDPARNGTLYYSGQTECGSAPTGFDAQAPAGMLCAFKTNDGRTTYFYYLEGLLSRVVLPGNLATDYGYDQAWWGGLYGGEVLYELSTVRDALANDALAAGVRTDPYAASTTTSADYLRRINAVWEPSPTEDSFGEGHVFDRYPDALDKSYHGRTDVHSQSIWEPNGFSRRIKYDNLYRTFEDTDMTNLTTLTEWDPLKDLRYSTTTPEGLKNTTVYDDEDRPIDSYGPAPKEWFGTDRKPLAAYTNQVPRTQTKYDENMAGPQVAYFNYKATNKTLLGAPKLHTTGIGTANPGLLSKTWSAPPITPDSGTDGWGLRANGRVRVPTTGTYTFHLWHDDGASLYIDDQLVAGDWNNGAYRQNIGTKVLEAGKPYRFHLQYYDNTSLNNGASLNLLMSAVNAQPVASDNNWGQKLLPDYSLTTSTKVFDSQVGDVTNTINYGNQPEFGLAQSSTATGGTQSLTSTNIYETPGSGFLRKSSSTMPGGGTTTYTYYGSTETADNPCTTTTTEAFKQGGQLKIKTSLDPDNTGPLAGQTTQTIYDNTGRAVAMRANSDPWTCTTYDTRGRVTKTVVPTINGRAGRTVTYNYAVGGNPFISSTTDTTTGTNTAEIDLLGRVTQTTDTFGYQTTLYYNEFNQIRSKKSVKGEEWFNYDEYGRLIYQSFYDDNDTEFAAYEGIYAEVSYDQYNRISDIEYPIASNGTGNLRLTQVKRDATQQVAGATYAFSNGATYDETVGRTSQTGIVTSDTISYGGKTASNSYLYDSFGRLTGATIDKWQYQYNFGAQDASCTSLTGYNPNAHKNGNRTSTTITNILTSTSTTTKHCYNFADQLIKSTDVQIGTPTYDSHGNITQFNGGGTPIVFGYNASDQNILITQGTNKVEYTKDIDGNVLTKKEYRNGALNKVYRNAGGTMLSCSVSNQSQCSIADRYIALPGGVALTLTNTSATTIVTKYSIQNFHGDTAITVGANGLPTSSVYMYDPFGQAVASSTFGTSGKPDNATGDDMGWATAPSRKQESMFTLAVMQMGARVYVPSLGRFIQVDPTQGGTPNAYAYVLDPVNYADYNGQWGLPKWVKTAAKIVVAAVVVVGIVAACIAFCAAAAAAIAASAPVVATVAAFAAVAVRAAPYIARAPALVSKASAAARSASVKLPTLMRMGSNQAATKTATGVNQAPAQTASTVTRFVDQGRAMVNSQGFQMTEYYHNRLISQGRADFAARANNILTNYTSKSPDPKGYPGFYRYASDGWELIYNPVTKEVSHLSRYQ